MKLTQQIFRFGIVGVVCFIIDYGLMVLLTEVVGMNYLLSCAVSFTVSVIVNYICSVRFVFDTRNKHNRTVQILVFILLSTIGLGLNQVLMYLFVTLGMYYMVAKIFVTGIVMIYNFITRKKYLEYEKIPD